MRTLDEIIFEVAHYVPPALFQELIDALEKEVEEAITSGSEEFLNEW